MSEPKRPDSVERLREAAKSHMLRDMVPLSRGQCVVVTNYIENLERQLENQTRICQYADAVRKRMEAAEAMCEFVADLDADERPNSAELDELQKRWLETRGDGK